MRMTVIGTGYLGATHAACMAELGHEVLGVDVDEDKISVLQSGKVPFFEPGLPDVLERNIGAGHLGFSTNYDEARSCQRALSRRGNPAAPRFLCSGSDLC